MQGRGSRTVLQEEEEGGTRRDLRATAEVHHVGYRGAIDVSIQQTHLQAILSCQRDSNVHCSSIKDLSDWSSKDFWRNEVIPVCCAAIQ